MSDRREASQYALGVLASGHAETVMSYALWSKERPAILVKRMSRFLLSKLEKYSDAQVYNLYHYEVAASQDKILLQGSIAFPLSLFRGCSAFNSIRGSDGNGYLVADIRLPHQILERIIPMQVFVPYEEAPSRQEKYLRDTDMLPIFFINEDMSVGFPLSDDRNFSKLLHKDCELPPRTSLKLKFAWPGYPEQERQIQYKKKPGEGDGAVGINIGRLAMLVHGAVANFMAEPWKIPQTKTSQQVNRISRTSAKAPDRYVEHPKWRIKDSMYGGITSRDVIVLGVCFVSPGAAMPILRVRDDFVFPGESSSVRSANPPVVQLQCRSGTFTAPGISQTHNTCQEFYATSSAASAGYQATPTFEYPVLQSHLNAPLLTQEEITARIYTKDSYHY